MSTSNGTATIEAVVPAVIVAETSPAPVGVETLAIATVAPTLEPPKPTERPSALDRALDWLGDVARMRDALAEEEAELAARLDQVRSTRARLGQVVAIFEAPIPSAPAPAPLAAAPVVVPPTTEAREPAAKRWATKFDACINCGTTERKHAHSGRCGACTQFFAKHGQERPADLWSKEQTS